MDPQLKHRDQGHVTQDDTTNVVEMPANEAGQYPLFRSQDDVADDEQQNISGHSVALDPHEQMQRHGEWQRRWKQNLVSATTISIAVFTAAQFVFSINDIRGKHEPLWPLLLAFSVLTNWFALSLSQFLLQEVVVGASVPLVASIFAGVAAFVAWSISLLPAVVSAWSM